MRFVKAKVTGNLSADVEPDMEVENVKEKPALNQDVPPLPYKIPEWSKKPSDDYYFEILKNGRSSTTDKFRQEVITFGRLPVCDISLEHQSISRYHAVIQFKEDGSKYIYDLGSTHGTYLNKTLVAKNHYLRLRVGDMLRFGASSRLFVLQGPEEAQPVVNAAPKAQPDEISWGMGGQDAFEGDEWAGKDLVLGMVDRSTIEEDAYYLKDPRKALTLWLENKGAELEIAIQEDEDAEASTFTARIELPVPLR
jgi:pSer/pThr/pTyr-binding forkhead associated (FHA) protein